MAVNFPNFVEQTSFNAYYQTAKGSKKKLNHILVQDVEDHEMAIKEVMSMLHTNMEAFFKPVLTVINGGKK